MNKIIKHIFSAFTACAVTAAVFTAVPVQAVGDKDVVTPEVGIDDEPVIPKNTFTEMCIGTKDGYSYSMWKDPDDNGKASITINEDGCFDCSWSGADDPEFAVGKNIKSCIVDSGFKNSEDYYFSDNEFSLYSEDGIKTFTVDYEAGIDCEGSYFFGTRCRLVPPTNFRSDAYLYIGEAYSDFNIIANSTKLGNITVNDTEYAVFGDAITVRDIENYDKDVFPKSSYAIWMLRMEDKSTDGTVKGTIDLDSMLKALNSLDIEMYSDYCIIEDPQLYVQGIGANGSVSIKKNEISLENYPEEEIKSGETIQRGDMTCSFVQNDKANGIAKVYSNGYMSYNWDNSDDDACSLLKAGLDVNSKYTLSPYTLVHGNTGYLVNFEGDELNGYAFGLCGTIGKPNVEFYIIDSCSEPAILKNAELVNIVSFSPLHQFRIYKETTDIDTEYGKTVRFFSVLTETDEKNKYNSAFQTCLQDHIAVWQMYGLSDSTVCEVSSFAEISGSSKGVLKLKLPYIDLQLSDKPYVSNYSTEYDVFEENDVEVLQKYLLGKTLSLPANKNYDINNDSAIDVYDLIKLRKLMVRKISTLPYVIDPDIDKEDFVSHETGELKDFLWGQNFDDDGITETVIKADNSLIGQWTDSDSAYFYKKLFSYNYFSYEPKDSLRSIDYNYHIEGTGSFAAGTVIYATERIKQPLFHDTIYIADCYNELGFLDEAVSRNEADYLGTINNTDGTEYEVFKRKGTFGLEIFLLRTEPLGLGEDLEGTIYYDALIDQLPGLIPDMNHGFISTYFGVTCFGGSTGAYFCNKANDRYEEIDPVYRD